MNFKRADRAGFFKSQLFLNIVFKKSNMDFKKVPLPALLPPFLLAPIGTGLCARLCVSAESLKKARAAFYPRRKVVWRPCFVCVWAFWRNRGILDAIEWRA